MVSVEELLERGVAPAGRWTTIAQWREADGSLVCVFDHENRTYSLALVPYAVEQLGDRDLQVAVPAEAVPATRNRAAFLTTDVTVLEDVDGQLQPVQVPSRSEALAWYGDLGGVTDVPDAGEFDGPPWLLDLVDWLESRRVERIRRRQYWAWHYRGRQILRVDRSRDSYRLLAGVAYGEPRDDQPEPVEIEATSETGPDSQEIGKLQQALDQAIERRRVGDDRGHREHLLQAALAVDPAILGMTELIREYPAWRPTLGDSAARGFVDFLGIDVDGGLHVVETKIGPDPMLGIQGLDSWAWVTAHKDEIARALGLTPSSDHVELHYVVAASDKPLLHAAATETMRRLDPEIPWRCHVVTDWNTVDRPRRLLSPHAVAGITPRTVPDDSGADST